MLVGMNLISFGSEHKWRAEMYTGAQHPSEGGG